MVAGAEGERCLDLDADAVERNAGAVVGAVNDKSPGLDRLQPGETFSDPVLRRNPLESERHVGTDSAGHCRQITHGPLVDRETKIEGHAPIAPPGIHQTDGNLVSCKTLRKQVRDPMRGLFIGFEAGNVGRAAGRGFGGSH